MRQTIITAERLVRTAQQIFEAAGVPPTKAAITANGLVAANLRGVDSHGVHLLPAYVDQIEGGDVNVRADGHVISESGGGGRSHRGFPKGGRSMRAASRPPMRGRLPRAC